MTLTTKNGGNTVTNGMPLPDEESEGIFHEGYFLAGIKDAFYALAVVCLAPIFAIGGFVLGSWVIELLTLLFNH